MSINGILWDFIETLAALERSGEDLLQLRTLIEGHAAQEGRRAK